MLNYCAHCKLTFHPEKWWWQEIETKSRQCMNCGKVTGMPNIKITAEVDGKIVPLRTISTESFEAIKALEKSKKIPVARIGNYRGNSNDRRLFLVISNDLRELITNFPNIKMVAITLTDGSIFNTWNEVDDIENLEDLYENTKPL